MAFTKHGYQIPGSPVEGVPENRARCGGLFLCPKCIQDAAAWLTSNAPKPDESRAGSHRPGSIMQYFKYQHLPPHLMMVSKAYAELATWTNDNIPEGPEKSVALRKLLEAKDAAVRAALELI